MINPIVIATLLLAIGGLLVLIAAWKARKGKVQKTDYKALFIMGICFLPLGIVLFLTTDNPGLLGITALGAVYMSMGLTNNNKSKKARNRRKR